MNAPANPAVQAAVAAAQAAIPSASRGPKVTDPLLWPDYRYGETLVDLHGTTDADGDREVTDITLSGQHTSLRDFVSPIVFEKLTAWINDQTFLPLSVRNEDRACGPLIPRGF